MQSPLRIGDRQLILEFMKKLFAVAPFLMITACGPAPDIDTRPAVPPAAQDTCDAGQYAPLVGQDATALERFLLLGQVRVIRPGMAVTMDFRPERINFNISPDNRITSITCN
jgi:hypothetical protein